MVEQTSRVNIYKLSTIECWLWGLGTWLIHTFEFGRLWTLDILIKPLMCETKYYLKTSFLIFFMMYKSSPVIFFQLYAVFPAHSKVGRGNLVLLCFPLCAEFWRHCVLSGGTQLRTLPRHQSEEMKIHLLEWGSNPQPVDFIIQSHFVPAPRVALSFDIY